MSGNGRDLEKLDAETEAEFQRVVAATKRPRERRRRQRLIGSPWGFLVDVCQLTKGRTALLVALCVYRRMEVCRQRADKTDGTFTLSGAELAELGINRRQKNRALSQLQAVGLIRLLPSTAGRSVKVVLLWNRTSHNRG